MRFKLFTAFLIISVLPVRGQQEDSLMIRKIADEILLHGEAWNNLRVLTKEIGHRLAGSPQMAKAEAWGRKALE